MPALQIADLNNAKTDVDHIADFASSEALTATDRLGRTKRTLAGIDSDAQDAIDGINTANVNAAASAVLASQWATKTDGAVSGGEFSSKYHAQAASASAAQAAVHENGAAEIVLGNFTQAGTGAEPRTFLDKAREWATPQDYMTDAQKADVAARTRLVDVTDAILKVFAAHKNVMFPPGDYRITMTESSPLIDLASESDIQVLGFGARFYDPHTYIVDSVTAVFNLDDCHNFKCIGLDYEGTPLASPSHASQGVGYRGATFINLENACSNIDIDAKLVDLRYGVRSGDYSDPTKGYNKKLRIRLNTVRCGYAEAHYLAEDVQSDIYAEGSHRTSYLAGVKGFTINARFKDQYIAPIQVLMTDATTNGLAYPNGESRGCSGGRVRAWDMGSTNFVANSWCAAISPSRVDPGTIYEDIEVDVRVVASDSVATTLGGFTIISTVKSILPAYPNNWESTIYLKRIKVSGVVDRSAQTAATHGVGELYITTIDTNYATVEGLDISGLQIINGAGSNPRALYCVVPGLTDRVNVEGCNFGNYDLLFQGNSTKPFNFINCAPIKATNTSSSDTTPINLVNTEVTGTTQPFAVTKFHGSPHLGAASFFRTKVIDVTLSGASVSVAGAIPAGVTVLGVSTSVKTTITGVANFDVGVSGTLNRYVWGSTGLTAGSRTGAVANNNPPLGYTAATALVVTGNGGAGAFATGVLRIAIHYIAHSGVS